MIRQFTATLLLSLSVAHVALAANWTMYRGDAGRSGYTSDSLSHDLSLNWIYKPAHVPAPAWPRDERMQFDWATHLVVVDGTVFYGDSVTGKISARDAATGKQKWEFFTEAPVRFAPAVWQDRIFVGSDDGFLYCLSNADGELIYKLRGSPKTDRVLGNGRIVSRRPVRGGPVVWNDIVYYAAGIWQSEGIYIHAIDPKTGKTLWTNDSSGGIYMAQPHGGAYAKSGVSAQGYLVVNDQHLFVPTGRAVPAAFNRSDGEFNYYHLQANTHRGGTGTSSIGNFVYNGGYSYETETGSLRTRFGDGAVASYENGILFNGGGQLQAYKPVVKDAKDRKGKPIKVLDHLAQWNVKLTSAGTSLIVAKDTAIAGGDKLVSVIDLASKKVAKTIPVDGQPYGLASANGRLYVSTNPGTIYCFGNKATKTKLSPTIDQSAFSNSKQFAKAAEEIVKKSKVTEGYCVDLGCGDGSLAYQLAKRTKLRIVAIDSDSKNVAAARSKLEAAGLYGSRVTVHLGDPSKTNYPKFFANLVVSARSLHKDVSAIDAKEVRRLQRPYGGIACLGKVGAMTAQHRGSLEKAGSWSHLYSNPANTACSADEIKGPLSVLWFRDVDVSPPQRHGRGPSPLFHEGRLFAQGMDELRAVDAYNGRSLWTFSLPGILDAYNADHIVGASATGSNLCAAGDSVYVRYKNHCCRLDTATGKVLGKFEAPKHKDGKPGRWGYLASEDGVLFGSVVNEQHIVRHAWRRADDQMRSLFTESVFLFAMDAKTGRLLWRYDAKESVRNNAIAIGDGRVFLIDRALAKDDLLARAPARRGEKGPPPVGHPTGELIMLEAKTGKRVWDNDKDIFGTVLVFSKDHDMLLMSYQSTRFKLPSEVGGRMAVFRASEGYRIWDKKMKYITRPLVNDQTIITQTGAWDLLSGEGVPFELKRSYGCGQIAASKNLLLFRSATFGYKDLSRKAGTENYGGVRPGCWINALPAGGLVLIPDASAGCKCSYQNRSWMALQGVD